MQISKLELISMEQLQNDETNLKSLHSFDGWCHKLMIYFLVSGLHGQNLQLVSCVQLLKGHKPYANYSALIGLFKADTDYIQIMYIYKYTHSLEYTMKTYHSKQTGNSTIHYFQYRKLHCTLRHEVLLMQNTSRRFHENAMHWGMNTCLCLSHHWGKL